MEQFKEPKKEKGQEKKQKTEDEEEVEKQKKEKKQLKEQKKEEKKKKEKKEKEKEKEKEKDEKKEKKEKVDKPKKENAYLMFAAAHRAAVTAAVKADNPAAPNTDVAKALGAKWKALSHIEQAEWKETAELQSNLNAENFKVIAMKSLPPSRYCHHYLSYRYSFPSLLLL